jgi:hypothetical protein
MKMFEIKALFGETLAGVGKIDYRFFASFFVEICLELQLALQMNIESGKSGESCCQSCRETRNF